MNTVDFTKVLKEKELASKKEVEVTEEKNELQGKAQEILQKALESKPVFVTVVYATEDGKRMIDANFYSISDIVFDLESAKLSILTRAGE